MTKFTEALQNIKPFPFYKQLDSMDCGPTCLRMIAKYYSKHFTLQSLREKCCIDREGVSLQGIAEAAEAIGFRTSSVKIPFSNENDGPSLILAPLPLIAHWNQNHFVVITKVEQNYVLIANLALIGNLIMSLNKMVKLILLLHNNTNITLKLLKRYLPKRESIPNCFSLLLTSFI